MLLRDFGVKVKNPKGGKPLPLAALEDTAEEDNGISGEFPEWALSEFRRSIMQILRNLMMNITVGNSIYPSSMEDTKGKDAVKLPDEYVQRVQSDDLADRRRYQTAAIANCQQLIQELQYFTDVFSLKYDTFSVNITKIMPFIDKIEFEIRLLKGWRKSTNELAKKIVK